MKVATKRLGLIKENAQNGLVKRMLKIEVGAEVLHCHTDTVQYCLDAVMRVLSNTY